MSAAAVPLDRSTTAALTMSEADLARTIREVSQPFGWRLGHFRAARGRHGWETPVQFDGAGFPDLVLVHAERSIVLFRELKSQRGRVDDAQRDWLDDLQLAGADAAVWRPSDLPAIVELVTNGRGRLQ